MPFFGQDPQTVANNYNNARQNAYNPAVDPGVFDNIGGSTTNALESSASSIGLLGADLVAPLAENMLDQQGKQIFSENRDELINMQRSLVPDAKVTGWLGKVIYGVVPPVTQAVAGSVAGGPLGAMSLVGGAQGTSRAEELKSEGVDSETAGKLGLLTGATQAAFTMLPGALGSTLKSKLLTGSAIQVGAGAFDRGKTSQILEENGYNDMAKQYRVLDGAAFFSDAVLGALGGAVHSITHGEEPNQKAPLPSQTDAALAANSLNHLELDSAPGVPTDLATRNSHIDAMTEAAQQIAKGDPVNVANVFAESNFLPKPGDAEAKAGMEEALAESGIPAFADEVRKTHEAIAEKTPAGDQLVIPGAERISDRQLAERNMQKPMRGGKEQAPANEGLFDSGARNQMDLLDKPVIIPSVKIAQDETGRITGINIDQGTPTTPRRIIDTHAPGLLGPRADAEVTPHLAEGTKALREGDIPKAPKEPETLLQFISKTGGIQDNGGDLAAMGAADWHKGKKFTRKLLNPKGATQDDMALLAWENGFFPGQSERPDINELHSAIENELRGKPTQRLNDVQAHADAADRFQRLQDLSNTLDQAGIDVNKATDQEVANALRDHSESNTPQTGLPTRDAQDINDDAEEAAARAAESEISQILKDNADMDITMEDGTTMNAREAYEQADAEISQAEHDAGLFEAAVSCFLRSGE